MVTISTTSGSVTVTFSDNDHYLYNGTLSFPLNSLVLVTDDSQMATFRNVAEDIVFSASYTELGMAKNDLIALYESSFVGGSISPEDVSEMIDEAVSVKQDISGMTAYTLTSTTDSLSGTVTAHTANQEIHTTAADKASWNAKVDRSELDAYATTTALNSHTSDATIHVTQANKNAWDAKVDQSDLDEYAMTDDVDDALEVATRALFDVRDDATQALTQLGGNSIVALTQAEYDALTTKDAHTLYIVTE